MTGIRRLCDATLRRYFVYLFVTGPALGTYSLQADQPAPPLGDIMASTPYASDGSCEPAFRGGPCGDCCMDLWRGYCQEKPHGFPISPRRYADASPRACQCQRCPHVNSSAACSQPQPQPTLTPLPQPVAPSGVPSNPPAPAAASVTPSLNVPAPSPPATTPVPSATIETSSPAWEPSSPAHEPTPAQPLSEPPLPKNVLPPQEVLEEEAPLTPTAPQASSSGNLLPVAPEPRPLSIRPASIDSNRGTARLVRQLKTIR